jgi:hypothetical protein
MNNNHFYQHRRQMFVPLNITPVPTETTAQTVGELQSCRTLMTQSLFRYRRVDLKERAWQIQVFGSFQSEFILQ